MNELWQYRAEMACAFAVVFIAVAVIGFAQQELAVRWERRKHSERIGE